MIFSETLMPAHVWYNTAVCSITVSYCVFKRLVHFVFWFSLAHKKLCVLWLEYRGFLRFLCIYEGISEMHSLEIYWRNYSINDVYLLYILELFSVGGLNNFAAAIDKQELLRFIYVMEKVNLATQRFVWDNILWIKCNRSMPIDPLNSFKLGGIWISSYCMHCPLGWD